MYNFFNCDKMTICKYEWILGKLYLYEIDSRFMIYQLFLNKNQ
jgi:hypothetical protein